MELGQHELQGRGIEELHSMDRDAGFVDMSPISDLRAPQMSGIRLRTLDTAKE